MDIVRVERQRRNLIVKLPESFVAEGTEVYIKEIGGGIVLLPVDDPWAPLVSSLDHFTDDFMEERVQPPQQACR